MEKNNILFLDFDIAMILYINPYMLIHKFIYKSNVGTTVARGLIKANQTNKQLP